VNHHWCTLNTRLLSCQVKIIQQLH
jgi:hypothetical protein